jgi:ribosomal protein S27AE
MSLQKFSQMEPVPPKPGYLLSILDNRCPRCRRGHIFASGNPYDLGKTVRMKKECPECGQPTEIEVGFYYGTGYVSYALSTAMSVASFLLWWVTIGFSLDDSRFFWWMGVNAVLLVILQPLLMRMSRTFWLSWFVKYDPHWQTNKIESPERVNKDQENNW